MADAVRPLVALQDSHTRLVQMVGHFRPEDLTTMSYASEWTIADVLSHLGSGAEISLLRLEASAKGEDPPGRDAAQPVWDRWNAKSPEAKTADAIAIDAAFLQQLTDLDDEARAAFHVAMGPMTMDFDAFVSSRLSEHTLHSWDIAVALDPKATLPREGAALVFPNVSRIMRFAGRPVEPYRTLHIHTTEPDADLTLDIAEGGVTLAPSESSARPDLTLPTEAFVRLVYGRLDPDHTPAGAEAPELDQLRQVFPGI
jgi:uncharacterized protein (TIGR03083 family)